MGFREQRAEGSIWIHRGGSNRKKKKLHNEKLHDYNASSNRHDIEMVKSMTMRWAWYEALLIDTYKLLVGNLEKNRPLEGPMRSW
jgi:hypothetical protein